MQQSTSQQSRYLHNTVANATCPAQASLLAMGCEGIDVPAPPSNRDKSRGGVVFLMSLQVTAMISRKITPRFQCEEYKSSLA